MAVIWGTGKTADDIYDEKPIRQSDRSLSVIDHMHRLNHEGNLYKIPYFKTVANSSYSNIWIYSPSTTIECHMYASVTADNSGTMEIYKGSVSATSQWSSITPIQSNGFSTNVSQAIIYSGGVPATSLLLIVQSIGSGGKTTHGGSGEVVNELILQPNSTYSIKFTCTSTESDVAYNIVFYEEE